jgi:FlaG/FlaF family flagellin (archaellin)
MKRMNNEAVSPVVGVMLMLVVTIIIAAVVSAFAGGLASDESQAPVATLAVTPMIEDIQDIDTDTTYPNYNYQPDYPAGFEADNGLLFEHKGGDSFALSDINIQIQSWDTKITIGFDDVLPTDSSYTCLSSDVNAYLMEVGDIDGFITPGDKFMLYADACRIEDILDSSYADTGKDVKVLCWKPERAVGGFAAYFNTNIEYKVIDKASGTAIQSGSIVLQ